MSPPQPSTSAPEQPDPVIAVIIPAYRVERHILDVLRGMPAFISHVIVVEDRGGDRTAEIVGEFAREDSRVELIRHARNRGVGGALITGYKRAIELGADIAVKMDGDDQMDPARLPELLFPLLEREADYTKGNRFFDLASLQRMPALRRFGNTGLTFLTKAASGYWNISDPNNGYTAIRVDALRRIDFSRIHRRYFFESSMLIHLNILKAVVADVPLPARYGNEVSSLSIRRVLWEFPLNLACGFASRVYWKYLMLELAPQGLFLLTGTVLALFGLLFGAWRWYISLSTQVIQSTGTVMLALLPFLLGFQLILQAIVLDVEAVPRVPLSRRPSRGRHSPPR